MFEPPYPPYDPTDTSGFSAIPILRHLPFKNAAASYETVLKRWPSILTGIVNQVYNVNHDLTLLLQAQYGEGTLNPAGREEVERKIEEGKKVIEKVSFLKYAMARDQVMEPLPNDSESHIETYNSELQRLASEGKNTWFKAPWLFAEYRLFRNYFALTTHWQTYDPFFDQKMDAFSKSREGIYKIATTAYTLSSQPQVQLDRLKSSPDDLGIIFKEMIQMCLWGNATDLSLLTQLSEADILILQCTDIARDDFILRNDQDAVWEWLKQLDGARVDFVLDNAGFELFTDLVLADFLVTYTPYVSKVVFHPKQIPWFVSDVTPVDFHAALTSLLDPSFFDSSSPTPPDPSTSPASPPPTATDPGSSRHCPKKTHLKLLLSRIQSHLTSGKFTLARASISEFWTTPWPYWDMQIRAPELCDELKRSDLVIFKGDLNYRKLTGDIQWPASTPFHEAVGPLAGSFPLLSLRTCKADVVVGIDQNTADELDKSGEKWRVNGRYALVSFLPKVDD